VASSHHSDVVCLQELKAPEEKFPVAAIEGAGYGAIWHGQKSWKRRCHPRTRLRSSRD
jgi:exonuclease III